MCIRDRSRVYLDGSFAFVLYNGEIKRFHIEEGEELAQELYSQIMDEVLCRRARERMLHLLKSTSRTELEIRRKLGEALYPQQAIDKAVAFAKRYHYICLLYTSCRQRGQHVPGRQRPGRRDPGVGAGRAREYKRLHRLLPEHSAAGGGADRCV